MKDEIKLELQAQDFEGINYFGFGEKEFCGCAIERAFVRQERTKLRDISECVNYLDVKDMAYSHEYYSGSDFRTDKMTALGQPKETVIRTLTLTKQ